MRTPARLRQRDRPRRGEHQHADNEGPPRTNHRATPLLVQDVPQPAHQPAPARDRGQGRRGPRLGDQLEERLGVIRPRRADGEHPVVARELGELTQADPRPPGQRIPGQDAGRELADEGRDVIAPPPVGQLVTEDRDPVDRPGLLMDLLRDQEHRPPAPAPDRGTAQAGRHSQLGHGRDFEPVRCDLGGLSQVRILEDRRPPHQPAASREGLGQPQNGKDGHA